MMTGGAAEAASARGYIPNTRWRNPSWDDLRAGRGRAGDATATTRPLIDGLPFRPRNSPAALPAYPADHARVRQTDRSLTRVLHAGVLTGGRLLAFLGFRDAPAAARLGLPPPFRGGVGAAFASVAADLAQPVWDASQGLLELEAEYDETEARAAGGGEEEEEAAAVQPPPRRRPHANPAALAAAGPGAVAMAWGSTHEPAALSALALALAPAGSRVGEAGLFRVAPAALAVLGLDPARTPLPALGASPDGLVTHCLTQACVDGALRRAGGRGVGDTGEGPPIRAPASWTEVVEVKSVSPFTTSRHGPPFALDDPGPRSSGSKGLARALPQLQLEMLAAGTTSGLLVSSSATRGARVWRSRRDDAYLRFMLEQVVSPAFVVATVGAGSGAGGASKPRPSKKKERGGPATTFRHPAGEEAVQRLVSETLRLVARMEEVSVIPPAAGWGCSQAEAVDAFLK